VNILHVIASLDPRGGGPMEGVRQIARAALAWGQNTTVVCLDAPGQAFLEGNPFKAIALGPGILPYGYTPRLAPWLREHAREYDAIIVNGIWQYSSFAVWRALHGTGIPYFVFPHGMLDPYFKRAYPLKHLKKRLYWRLGEYRVLRDARAVLFTCEEEMLLARESFRQYRCREQVAGYGTAPPPYEREAALAAYHTAHADLAGRRTLLFLSRIHEKKGCDLLITAFAAIAGSDPGLQLVLAGPVEADYGARLKALARRLGVEARITWTGMLAGACKWGALYAAEAFVLPSHQENFGIAVAEAMACGTPVLISNRVNIWREIVADGAGLVGPDTLDGTSELLQRWTALDATGRAAMRDCARGCFETRFDIRAVARRLTDTIARLAAAPPTHPIAGAGTLAVTGDSGRHPAVSR
jgi:glycosyltransferase involved in cell wall biosynthesis